MKQIIFKYPFSIETQFRLELPVGSRILFVEKQRSGQMGIGPTGPPIMIEQPAIWAVIDPDEQRKEFRTFKIVGTGHEFNSKGLNYIGSLMMSNDQLVWHCWEFVTPGAIG